MENEITEELYGSRAKKYAMEHNGLLPGMQEPLAMPTRYVTIEKTYDEDGHMIDYQVVNKQK